MSLKSSRLTFSPTSFSLELSLLQALVPGTDGHFIAFQDTILAWRPNTKVGHPTPNDRHEAGANSITQPSTASRPNSAPRRRGQIDISSFFKSLLHQISDDSSFLNEPAQRNNPHTVSTPVDVAGLFRLVQDQFRILARDAPETTNRDFLISLIDSLNSDIFNPPKDVEGVSQEFLDVLERVPNKSLKPDNA